MLSSKSQINLMLTIVTLTFIPLKTATYYCEFSTNWTAKRDNRRQLRFPQTALIRDNCLLVYDLFNYQCYFWGDNCSLQQYRKHVVYVKEIQSGKLYNGRHCCARNLQRYRQICKQQGIKRDCIWLIIYFTLTCWVESSKKVAVYSRSTLIWRGSYLTTCLFYSV